jgi:FtsP/CotA-like multicopper oxidase with cupredoxin domain
VTGAVVGGAGTTGPVTRRRFLGVAAGVALTGAGLDLLGGSASMAPAGGGALREPRRLQSRGGLLTLTLQADERDAFVAGENRQAIVYNGSFPGPTLVVDPGDRIKLRLVNRLEDPTNLHTHGFHVSPEGNSDNVLMHVEPEETFDFQFDLPRSHAPGLNWYHPHHHGHGTRQMFGGMAGAVIFRSRAERRGTLPPMRDRVLVLQAPEWDESGQLKTCSPGLLASQLRLVNGQLNPRIPIGEGETQRWRILNASVSDFFDLRVDGHRLVQIAADGNPFERARELDTIHIPPGGRAEVLVEGGPPGGYALRALPSDHGERGSSTVKTAPPPGAFEAATRPPCASTIAATIASPSPAPARPRSRPPSARQKRSNSASDSAEGRPGPWSRTASRTRPSAGATDTSMPVPDGVCTSALRSRLASTWRSWCASPRTEPSAPGSSAISRSGAVARASETASPASAARSTSVCGASAISSSRASVRRSSTSTPMRAASSSIRRIALSTSAGSRAAPMRNSSA